MNMYMHSFIPFLIYVFQFKREIADDIADLVTRRTVHQVLRGLEDNDVKTTFSRGSPFRGMVEARTTSSSSEEGTSESTNPEQAQIESEVKLQSQVSEESAAGSLSSQEGGKKKLAPGHQMLTHCPWAMWLWFQMCKFQTQLGDWYLEYSSKYYRGSHWW